MCTSFRIRRLSTLSCNNVRLAEAPSHGKSIFQYAPESAGAQDYAALAEEVEAMAVAPRALPVAEPEVRVDEILAQIEPPPA